MSEVHLKSFDANKKTIKGPSPEVGPGRRRSPTHYFLKSLRKEYALQNFLIGWIFLHSMSPECDCPPQLWHVQAAAPLLPLRFKFPSYNLHKEHSTMWGLPFLRRFFSRLNLLFIVSCNFLTFLAYS